MKRFTMLALALVIIGVSGCATAKITIEQPMERGSKPSFKVSFGNGN